MLGVDAVNTATTPTLVQAGELLRPLTGFAVPLLPMPHWSKALWSEFPKLIQAGLLEDAQLRQQALAVVAACARQVREPRLAAQQLLALAPLLQQWLVRQPHATVELATAVTVIQEAVATMSRHQPPVSASLALSASPLANQYTFSSANVVWRHPECEVLRYLPDEQSSQWQQAVVLIPPFDQRYGLFDLHPQMSLVQALQAQGFVVYCMSWRNPSAAQANWDLARYLAAGQRLVKALRQSHAGLHFVGVELGAVLASLLANDTSTDSMTTVEYWPHPAAEGTVLLAELTDAICAARQNGVVEPVQLERAGLARPDQPGHGEAAERFAHWRADRLRLSAELYADMLGIWRSGALVGNKPCKVGDQQLALNLDRHRCYQVLSVAGNDWQQLVAQQARVPSRGWLQLASANHLHPLLSPSQAGQLEYAVYSPNSLRQACLPENWQQGGWWSHWFGWLQNLSQPLSVAESARQAATRLPVLGEAPGRYARQT